jgi:hypothetical protein
MPYSSAADELQTLRARLDEVEGVETIAGRPADAAEGRFQRYVAMRARTRRPSSICWRTSATPTAVGAIFHVGEQKCELGFRVEVTTSQGALCYDFRFWGYPAWKLHRRRIAGDAAHDDLSSPEPPTHVGTE